MKRSTKSHKVTRTKRVPLYRGVVVQSSFEVPIHERQSRKYQAQTVHFGQSDPSSVECASEVPQLKKSTHCVLFNL